MQPRTKYILIAAGIVLVVIIAYVAWRRYRSGSGTQVPLQDCMGDDENELVRQVAAARRRGPATEKMPPMVEDESGDESEDESDDEEDLPRQHTMAMVPQGLDALPTSSFHSLDDAINRVQEAVSANQKIS